MPTSSETTEPSYDWDADLKALAETRVNIERQLAEALAQEREAIAAAERARSDEIATLLRALHAGDLATTLATPSAEEQAREQIATARERAYWCRRALMDLREATNYMEAQALGKM